MTFVRWIREQLSRQPVFTFPGLSLFPNQRAARTRAPEHAVMTELDKPLRRELRIADRRYTLTIDPSGLKLAERGHRHGVTMKWEDLLNGDAAVAAALKASLA